MADLLTRAASLTDAVGVRTLDGVAILHVEGEDAHEWLNGQITNDVRATRPGSATYALVVNLKGRILTDLWVLDRGASFDVLVPADLRSSLMKHFDEHIIMEDVVLGAPEGWTVLTAQGPRAEAAVAAVEGIGDAAFACDRLGTGGRDVVVPREQAVAVMERLAAAAGALGGGVVDEAAWELARLRLGVPRFGADFGEETLPQEAALGARAVSFEKGCYAGQEAIVMLEHRGRPPKRLARITIDRDVPPPARTPLVAEDGSEAGYVTTAVANPRSGNVLALGYVRRGHAVESTAMTVDGAPALVTPILP